MTSAPLRTLKFALGACCLFMLLSCSLFSFKNTTHYRDSEGHFSSALLDSVENKKTSLQWLKSQFGEPLFIDSGPEGAAICTWRFYKQTLKNNSVFLLWNQKKLSEEPLYLHTVVQDGMVLKSWRDHFEKVDTQRIFSDINILNDTGVVEKARQQVSHPKQAASKAKVVNSSESMEHSSQNSEHSSNDGMSKEHNAGTEKPLDSFADKDTSLDDRVEPSSLDTVSMSNIDNENTKAGDDEPIGQNTAEDHSKTSKPATTMPSIAPSNESNNDKDVLYGL